MSSISNGNGTFKSQEDYEAFLTRSGVEESFRQKAVVVKQVANANLRASLELLVKGAAANPGQIEFFAIDETGEKKFFGNLTAAKEWGRARRKMFVVGHVRLIQTFELSDVEVAARVAAMGA